MEWNPLIANFVLQNGPLYWMCPTTWRASSILQDEEKQTLEKRNPLTECRLKSIKLMFLVMIPNLYSTGAGAKCSCSAKRNVPWSKVQTCPKISDARSQAAGIEEEETINVTLKWPFVPFSREKINSVWIPSKKD